MSTHPGLYDGSGAPLLGSPDLSVSWAARPCCRLLFDADVGGSRDREDVDRHLTLPAGAGPFLIAPDVLGDLVHVLDDGGRIAILADAPDAIEFAISVILSMAGGARA